MRSELQISFLFIEIITPSNEDGEAKMKQQAKMNK